MVYPFLAFPLVGILLLLWLRKRPVQRVWSVFAICFLNLGFAVHLAFTSDQTFFYQVGGWEAPFGIALHVDALTRLMLLLTGVIFFVSSLYLIDQEGVGGKKPGGTVYHLSFVILLLAVNGLFMTGDFFNFFVFFELMAVSSYMLVSMGKRAPLEATWKYAVQSMLASAALLVGVSLLYGAAGSLNMAEVAGRLTEPAAWLAPFFLFAFLLKGSVFPFHFWQSDAHAAATTAGSVILAGVLINVGVYGLVRFWPLLMVEELRWILIWIGSGSILFGAMAAWQEKDIKRVLGFSSTSQLGFVLLGLGWGGIQAVTASLFFMVGHGLAKATLFLATGILTDAAGTTRIASILGLGCRLPWLKAAYFLGFISLVGLPPAVGFLGKLGVFSAGVQAKDWFWLSMAALGSLLTLAYGGRIFQNLFWVQGDRAGTAQKPGVFAWTAVLGLAAVLVWAGLLGQPLWELSERSAIDANSLGNRSNAGRRP